MADDAGPSSAGAGPSYDGDEEPSTSTAVSAAWTPADNPSGIKPILQNIVATCNLATELDLKTIALKARNAEYNPKRFAAVIMRIRDPKTTALIFRSGKMVVTGAKSEEDARMAARKYARIIQKLDFPARFADFKIQNMVRPADAAHRRKHAGSERPSARGCNSGRLVRRQVPNSPRGSRVQAGPARQTSRPAPASGHAPAVRPLAPTQPPSEPPSWLALHAGTATTHHTSRSSSRASSTEWCSRRSCCSSSYQARWCSRAARSARRFTPPSRTSTPCCRSFASRAPTRSPPPRDAARRVAAARDQFGAGSV